MATQADWKSILENASASVLAALEFVPKPGRPQGKIDLTRLETPIGPMFAAAVAEGICLLEFVERRALPTELRDLAKKLNAQVLPGDNPHFPVLKTQLDEYFAGKRRTFDLPLAMPGTAFQQTVWQQLLTIPCGQTRSYAEQAERVGKPGAIRAVGTANGANRISIVVPCHRVVGSDGSLTGYGGGLWRKQWLLDLERGEATPSIIPPSLRRIPA